MNKILLALTLLTAPLAAFSQARLVINGATPVTIVENGGVAATPIYIEIANPAANAITVSGTSGWIISESEFNMVKWDIGTSTGAYTVPWGYSTTDYLPLTLNLSTAGTGTGSILFSTYHTSSADQFLAGQDPSDVTNMASNTAVGAPSTSDNSYNAVDRFWIMDTYKGAFAYTTKPAASSIVFNYIHANPGAEFAAPNISADESDLIAQRFNPGAHLGWGDWFGSGTWAISGNIGTVTNTNAVSAANFFRSWTLSNSTDPLPISISSLTAQCDNGAALIQWTSQSELNNAYYTVKKTTDNIHFETVATVLSTAPGGNSSFPINYSVTDNAPDAGQSYYFLYQTDLDGNTNPANIPFAIFTGCGTDAVTTVNAYNTTNNIVVQINSVSADEFNISLINMLGQTIYTGPHSVALGNNEIMLPNDVSPGVYVLTIRNEKVNYSKKMVIGVFGK